MPIKFYTWWTPVVNPKVNEFSTKEERDEIIQHRRIHMNDNTQKLSNELETVLGNSELVSLTSSATKGIVVTTIAYEVPLSEELPE